MVASHSIQGLLIALCMSLMVSACAQEKPPAKPAPSKQTAAEPGPLDSVVLGMGCFWGAEKRMSEIPGVVDVESGYANGDIEGRYEAVLAHERKVRMGLSGKRNHAEVVKVRFDPAQTSLEKVLMQFWENHDPTQGDRQGHRPCDAAPPGGPGADPRRSERRHGPSPPLHHRSLTEGAAPLGWTSAR